eukprot:TRINITY_DN3770_c0_g1_i2.p1 TRINITY_DN3770_c0_g1~~TRINITY_DN3770_c0_g1_i2.p1  ORF type:complete len:174 (-),score=43.70 TRINITY_DN3770_c0_g1_i2:167-688(-)
MGAGASAAKDASQEDLQSVFSSLTAADRARVKLAIAWADLEKTIQDNKELVDELFQMEAAPPKVVALEEALCKLCSLDVLEVGGKPDYHFTARRMLYDDCEDAGLHEAQNKVAEMRGKIFLAKLLRVKPESASKIADFVNNADFAPEKFGPIGLLAGKVSVWLHAYHSSFVTA